MAVPDILTRGMFGDNTIAGLTRTYLIDTPFPRSDDGAHTLEGPGKQHKPQWFIATYMNKSTKVPVVEECRCKSEGMQGVCWVQTWHRDPLVSRDTGLLTWGPSQTCHPSTE